MKLTLHSTSRLISVNGCPARVWEGETESGVAVVALIAQVGTTSIPVDGRDHLAEFERALNEHEEPSAEAWAMFPYAAIVLGPRRPAREG